MADTAIAITAGSGTNVDTRTEGTNGNHRQVIVLGDPATNAGVAPVDATKGLAVDLTATGANTTAIKVNVASGGIASGGIASGAVASGAVASGAIASGAIASGAIAAGAGADGWNVTLGSKTDAKNTATDTTSVSAISLLKQISASNQSLVSNSTALGQATKANSIPVVPSTDWVYNTGYYVAVAASQTDAVIQSSTGATGDYISGVLVIPATTAPGVVTVKDNSTAIVSYPGGGTTALLTLTPFFIPIGAVSRSGAWKITTGSNVSVVAVGRFS